ncbi:MAG TPA: hypothetical protein VGJ60_34675 [Chloroflexota bacterium]|jgi:hypothetical protein
MDGRLYRVLRSSEMVAPDRLRLSLRAQAIDPQSGCPDLELAREVDTAVLRDKIANRHVIPTPESTLEALWQQLRIDLDAREGR